MAYFDRFDICEAYALIEAHYNVGGWLRERASNQRRRESIGVQLHRMQYRPSPFAGTFEHLTENGREIYEALVARYFPNTATE